MLRYFANNERRVLPTSFPQELLLLTPMQKNLIWRWAAYVAWRRSAVTSAGFWGPGLTRAELLKKGPTLIKGWVGPVGVVTRRHLQVFGWENLFAPYCLYWRFWLYWLMHPFIAFSEGLGYLNTQSKRWYGVRSLLNKGARRRRFQPPYVLMRKQFKRPLLSYAPFL